MPSETTERLQWLCNRFRQLAQPPGLFHATRVRLDGKPCGSDGLASGWDDFLVGVEPFEFSCFETAAAPDHQQSCFYGNRSKLLDYTPLAVEAIGLCRPGVCPTLYHHRNARPDRDQWTIGLYSAANVLEWDIAIDSLGSGPYAAYQLDSKDALAAVAGTRDGDRLRRHLATLAGLLKREHGNAPTFVYACLATDVCTASAHRIQAEIRDLEAGRYGPRPDVILPGGVAMEVAKKGVRSTVEVPGASADEVRNGGEETVAEQWPPDGGWHFRGATFAFQKRTGRAPANAMRLLRAFTAKGRRLDRDSVRTAVWGNTRRSDQQMRTVIKKVRDALREAFAVSDQDPVPHEGTGELAVWWVDQDLLIRAAETAQKTNAKPTLRDTASDTLGG